MDAKAAIIILNWNGWRDTIECLKSLYNINYNNYNILVLDNSSTDESVKMICDYCSHKSGTGANDFSYLHDDGSPGVKGYKTADSKLIFIINDKNYGFAEGNNIGIRYAMDNLDPDYILLLNNDTSVEENFLRHLVEAMEKDGGIGISQPKILNSHNRDIIDSTGHVFGLCQILERGHGEVDKGQYDEKTDIIGACAAAALYRTEMLRQIGLFNARFFMQYEDAELSWRAFNLGWSAKFVPISLVYHKRGGSTNKKIASKILRLNLRNMSITVKLHGRPYQMLCFAFSLFYNGIFSELGKLIGQNDLGGAPYFHGIKIMLSSLKNEDEIYRDFDSW